MRHLHNIEKSAFRRDEYVGYSKRGIWRIAKITWFRRLPVSWRATCAETGERIYEPRLKDISTALETMP